MARLVSRSLGSDVVSERSVSGGDIGASHRVELADGRNCFVKSYGKDSGGMTRAEAVGLHWLRVPGAPRIPEVLALHEDTPSFLVLEWIEPGTPGSDHDESLGRALAALHQNTLESFGFESDNFIGPLTQSNRAHPDWPTFYARERIEPQVRLARDAGHFSKSQVDLARRVVARLPALCGPLEAPARLHGDLWGGNALTDDHGMPCLIDPAVYGGHREIDLAMMRLFGGFSQRVFDAYAEAWPLQPGSGDRVELYQLYPVLVHVNLFGAGYTGSALRILQRYA